MIWKVTYTHDRAVPGMVYAFEVEAPTAEIANMRAGMARAESHTSKFTNRFYWPNKVHWLRLSTEEIRDDENLA